MAITIVRILNRWVSCRLSIIDDKDAVKTFSTLTLEGAILLMNSVSNDTSPDLMLEILEFNIRALV